MLSDILCAARVERRSIEIPENFRRERLDYQG